MDKKLTFFEKPLQVEKKFVFLQCQKWLIRYFPSGGKPLSTLPRILKEATVKDGFFISCISAWTNIL